MESRRVTSNTPVMSVDVFTGIDVPPHVSNMAVDNAERTNKEAQPNAKFCSFQNTSGRKRGGEKGVHRASDSMKTTLLVHQLGTACKLHAVSQAVVQHYTHRHTAGAAALAT
eukprot:1151347-Pelagomonas_calceolata.AAC.8